jgi:hypothetical protein
LSTKSGGFSTPAKKLVEPVQPSASCLSTIITKSEEQLSIAKKPGEPVPKPGSSSVFASTQSLPGSPAAEIAVSSEKNKQLLSLDDRSSTMPEQGRSRTRKSKLGSITGLFHKFRRRSHSTSTSVPNQQPSWVVVEFPQSSIETSTTNVEIDSINTTTAINNNNKRKLQKAKSDEPPHAPSTSSATARKRHETVVTVHLSQRRPISHDDEIDIIQPHHPEEELVGRGLPARNHPKRRTLTRSNAINIHPLIPDTVTTTAAAVSTTNFVHVYRI